MSERFNLIPEDNLTIPQSVENGYDENNPNQDDDFYRGSNQPSHNGDKSRSNNEDDDEEDGVEQDDFDAEGRLVDKSSMNTDSASKESLHDHQQQPSHNFDYHNQDAAGESLSSVSSISPSNISSDFPPNKADIINMKTDFPLFVSQESDSQTLSEEEKNELHASQPRSRDLKDVGGDKSGEIGSSGSGDGNNDEDIEDLSSLVQDDSEQSEKINMKLDV